jgi:hopanoid biosynthesis associated protein HpnK
VRRLVVNADDFGLTSGVNHAIAEGHRNGIVTSTTLMANSQAFHEAVELAGQCPGLSVGCHVVLVDDIPVRNDVPTLTNGTSRFRTSLKDFIQAALRKRILADEIQRETEAQIRKIQAAGIAVTHVDTHKHTHLFPQVVRPMVKAAKACGVHAIRNPFEPWHSGPRTQWFRSAAVTAFSVFAGRFDQVMRDEQMATTDGTIGIVATGKLDQRMLTRMLQNLPDGTWELVCHPGHCDGDLRSAGTRLLESREIELQALTSVETRQTLADREIELISYASLKRIVNRQAVV